MFIVYVNPCLDFQCFKNGCFLWENGANAYKKLFFCSVMGMSWLMLTGYCSLKTKQLKKENKTFCFAIAVYFQVEII